MFIKERHGLYNFEILIPIEMDGRVGSYDIWSQLPALFTLPDISPRKELNKKN